VLGRINDYRHRLIRQGYPSLLDHGAAGVDKKHPVAAQPLAYETLTAKKTRTKPLGKGDPDFGSQSGT